MSSLSPFYNSNSCSRTRVYLFPPKKRPCLSSESLKRDYNETTRVMKNVQIQRILFEHSYTPALPGQLVKTDSTNHDRLPEPPPENAISRSLLTFTGRAPPPAPSQVQSAPAGLVPKVEGRVPATNEKLSSVELDFDLACETDSPSSSSVASSSEDHGLLDLETDSEGQDSPALILSIPLSISRTTRPDEVDNVQQQLKKPVSPQEASETDEKERETATMLSLDSPTSSGGDGFHLTIESDEEEGETLRDGGSTLSNNQLDNRLVRSSSYSKVNRSIASMYMFSVNLHTFSYIVCPEFNDKHYKLYIYNVASNFHYMYKMHLSKLPF